MKLVVKLFGGNDYGVRDTLLQSAADFQPRRIFVNWQSNSGNWLRPKKTNIMGEAGTEGGRTGRAGRRLIAFRKDQAGLLMAGNTASGGSMIPDVVPVRIIS